MSKYEKVKVAELFAGVGGFRLGLEGWEGKSSLSNYNHKIESDYEIVWSNQWEPSTKSQDASIIYEKRFGKEFHSNEDIGKVSTHDIPNHDMLVGGFPCQDYSVARTLSQSGGLQGKKGVLWWEIHRILKEKSEKGNPVKYLFLENVDRLLKSPVKQRGRDFAIILASLSDLGYAVEWRVINAAEYGLPQRRRRTFILGFHKSTGLYNEIEESNDQTSWILDEGVMAKAFPVSDNVIKKSIFEIRGGLADISEDFSEQINTPSPFENSGCMINRKITSLKTIPKFEGSKTTLGDIILDDYGIPESFYLDQNSFEKWVKLKGAKSEERTNKTTGFTYKYSEGGMIFPDPLNQPSRTIITGEGGASPSRFKHVVLTKDGRHRRLMPIELERLNMFPDNHTDGASDVKRAFFMGNALVVGVIEKIGLQLLSHIKSFEHAGTTVR
ncbi:DNA (cytosine-5-)-methyltransferase [Pedobacter frigiditerrae]|uniref:DNA (cytosine-5-)-methyltransferase n=1 Tax=Pedobacter frigiditerrae TaxID=2530452 RepID=UPI00292ECF59|nr:DNA (cytosine-5-)-methyltransferase [Pedobacter frigiditerrae]